MLFIYYVINVYVPRVRANAYHVLTTPPRVFGDPKMCLRNIWTAPNCRCLAPGNGIWVLRTLGIKCNGHYAYKYNVECRRRWSIEWMDSKTSFGFQFPNIANQA